MDAVYLDIKKAFDRVPHKRLLWKLKHIGGLRGKVLEWMQDYLKDREMRTVIREAIKLDKCNKWSTAGGSPSTHKISNICK